MKAAIREEYGGPEVIEMQELEKPIPGSEELLIRVYATTINRTDCANLTAKPFIMRMVLGLIKPGNKILGTDFSGDVIATGENVEFFKTGDRVFGFIVTGASSQAEYVCVKKEHVFLVPEKCSMMEAAASLEGAHYAYSFIHKTNISAGQRVLINGSTGAIGSALLQLIRPYNIHITVTCNTKNIEYIEKMGPDKIIDYLQEDFTGIPDQYDFIFDAVGKSTFGKCKPLLKEGGTYISSELGPFAQNIFFALISRLLKKKVIFPIPNKTSITIPFIQKSLDQDVFKPLIDKQYSFDTIKEAYEYVMTGEKTGNVILLINN